MFEQLGKVSAAKSLHISRSQNGCFGRKPPHLSNICYVELMALALKLSPCGESFSRSSRIQLTIKLSGKLSASGIVPFKILGRDSYSHLKYIVHVIEDLQTLYLYKQESYKKRKVEY